MNKEQYMGFEKTVLDKVAKVIKQDRQAYFENGGLFVLAGSASQARRVYRMLFKDYGYDVHVGVHLGNGKFVYDFTGY